MILMKKLFIIAINLKLDIHVSALFERTILIFPDLMVAFKLVKLFSVSKL